MGLWLHRLSQLSGRRARVNQTMLEQAKRQSSNSKLVLVFAKAIDPQRSPAVERNAHLR